MIDLRGDDKEGDVTGIAQRMLVQKERNHSTWNIERRERDVTCMNWAV